MSYDRVSVSELDVLLHLIETIDSSAGIDRLATNSRTTGEYLRTIYGRAPDRVVYPGVNLPATVSPPSSSDPLLFVGNLWQHKRVASGDPGVGPATERQSPDRRRRAREAEPAPAGAPVSASMGEWCSAAASTRTR